MEFAPAPPPAGRQPSAPIPHSAEHEGFFDRWRKKDKNPEQPPQASNAESKTPETEAPRIERSRKQRLAAGLLRVLRGEVPQSITPETEAKNPTRPQFERQIIETNISEEFLPPLQKAQRVRRFAKEVINRVLGVAEEEHERVEQWDGQTAHPLDTEPLVEAAGDLRGAVEELDAAMPRVERQHATPSEATLEPYTDSDGTPNAVRHSFDTEPLFTDRVAQRVELHMQQLEQRVAQTEVGNRVVAAATVGLGVFTVLIAGTEFLSHRRIRREQQEMRRELHQHKRTEQEIRLAQEVAFAKLQQEREAAHTRSERQAYYRHLSEFTHQQADTTREVAHELRTQERPAPAAPEVVQILPRTEKTKSEWRRMPIREHKTPEQASKPLVRTEIADTVEQTGIEFGTSRPPQTTATGGGTFGGGTGINSASSDRGQEPKTSPESPQNQVSQTVRTMTTASAWLAGAALFAAVIGLLLLVISLSA